MMIKRSDINSVEEMIMYLQQLNNVKRLYHFTTYESLLSIIDTNSFRFSHISKLNDKKELEFAKNSDYYIMSLTGQREYISMWAMYGKPSGIKIRIDFPKSDYQKLFVKENVFCDNMLKMRYYSNQKKLFQINNISNDCLLSFVSYVNKEETQFKHNGNAFEKVEVNNSSLEALRGFVKYEAWEFEKEIRARLLPDYNNYHGLKPDYLYISLPRSFIEQIKVTFNPWLSVQMKESIRNNLLSYGIDCRDSDYDGQIDEL